MDVIINAMKRGVEKIPRVNTKHKLKYEILLCCKTYFVVE